MKFVSSGMPVVKHKGRDEPQVQTVGDDRAVQGVEEYDQKNRDGTHTPKKLASRKFIGGPWGKKTDERTKTICGRRSPASEAAPQPSDCSMRRRGFHKRMLGINSACFDIGYRRDTSHP